MRTFIKNYLHFIKNCIRPPVKKLKSLKSGFIKNSNFENNRVPWQVVSRRGELNRDLLSSTCEIGRFSKVRCRIGVKCSLVITILRNRNRTKSRELAMFNF